jgi:hypothetical protein
MIYMDTGYPMSEKKKRNWQWLEFQLCFGQFGISGMKHVLKTKLFGIQLC